MKTLPLIILFVFAAFACSAIAAPTAVHVTDKFGDPLRYVAVLIPDRQAVKPNRQNIFVMDQINKQFIPAVLVVSVNSLVNFPNQDDTRHHVYSFSEAKTFELRLSHAEESDPVMFDKPGLVKVGCNIHTNMRGFILVTERSVFGVTDRDGRYAWPELNQTPEQLEIWHPNLKENVIVNLDPNANVVEISLPIEPLRQPTSKQHSSLEDRLKRYKRDAE